MYTRSKQQTMNEKKRHDRKYMNRHNFYSNSFFLSFTPSNHDKILRSSESGYQLT